MHAHGHDPTLAVVHDEVIDELLALADILGLDKVVI